MVAASPDAIGLVRLDALLRFSRPDGNLGMLPTHGSFPALLEHVEVVVTATLERTAVWHYPEDFCTRKTARLDKFLVDPSKVPVGKPVLRVRLNSSIKPERNRPALTVLPPAQPPVAPQQAAGGTLRITDPEQAVTNLQTLQELLATNPDECAETIRRTLALLQGEAKEAV